MSATSRWLLLVLLCFDASIDAVVVHQWSFDGARAHDSVGAAHLSVSGEFASIRAIGTSGNAVLRLPTGDDFAISRPLGPATLAASFTLSACFRFDPMPSDGLDASSASMAHAERSVVTLMQSPRAASSFVELAVVQMAGVDERNRTACIYAARVRDEGGVTTSDALGLATGIVQFACWTLVEARGEAVLHVNGVAVLRHAAAHAAPFRAGLASIAIGRAPWAQAAQPSLVHRRDLPLEVDLVELYDHDITPAQVIARTAEIRCHDGLRGELLQVRPLGGLSGFFEDAVDCVLRSSGGVTEPCSLCSARCANGEQDGDEDGVDCGGSACAACKPAGAAERCVRFDQLALSNGVRRFDVKSAVAAVGIVAHSGLKLVDGVAGLVECVACPPTAPHLFRYSLAATEPHESVQVVCNADKAHSHDGCFGRALESDPKHAWFVVDLQRSVVLQELHWWLHWRSPGCVTAADVEVAGADFHFRLATSVEFDVAVASEMQVIPLDTSSTGADVRFVRIVARAVSGDDAGHRFTPAFRRILFYRHATAEDNLPLTGAGAGVGVGDDRLPLAHHAPLIDRGEIVSLTFKPPIAVQSVTLAAPAWALDRAQSARATLARLQCTDASRRTVTADLHIGTTSMPSARALLPVTSCLLTAAGSTSFQLSNICF